jgi:hypothetical protein
MITFSASCSRFLMSAATLPYLFGGIVRIDLGEQTKPIKKPAWKRRLLVTKEKRVCMTAKRIRPTSAWWKRG